MRIFEVLCWLAVTSLTLGILSTVLRELSAFGVLLPQLQHRVYEVGAMWRNRL
jgi:hypothetical protein